VAWVALGFLDALERLTPYGRGGGGFGLGGFGSGFGFCAGGFGVVVIISSFFTC